MDLSTFKELGIAVVAVSLMGYICFRLIDKWALSEENYVSFVNDNNHTTTELVREATATMVAMKNAIETHTKTVEKLTDKISK